MPWDYILGGAGGAGIALVLGLLFAQKFVEKLVETQFSLKLEKFRGEQTEKLEALRAENNTRIESLRGDFSRSLEFDKSDLSVWAELRKDILAEMWKAHRDIARQMTVVILKVQEMEAGKKSVKLEPAIDEYRQMIHSQIDLISPEALDVCQSFLGTAYEILQKTTAPQDGNPLKALRGKFNAHTAKLYGLEEMMPWMARGGAGRKKPKDEG